MTIKTIDDIQRALEDLGHHVPLSELAWLIERTMSQEKLAETLERAPLESKSRALIEFELKNARFHVRAAQSWIDQVLHMPEDNFEPRTVAGALSRAPVEALPSQEVTVSGKHSFANFWTDSDALQAPTLGIECFALREEKKSTRIILPLKEIMNCLMVFTGTLGETHAIIGIQNFYALKRTAGNITLKVGSDGIHHLVEMDPQGAFAVSSLLTAQIRLSMPAGASQDLSLLVDKVLAPLHDARRVSSK